MSWPDEDGNCKHLLVFTQCTLCNGREATDRARIERSKRTLQSSTWSAQFDGGPCPVCADPIEVGQSIGMAVSQQYIHAACAGPSPRRMNHADE